jgi:hypothetical protein
VAKGIAKARGVKPENILPGSSSSRFNFSGF